MVGRGRFAWLWLPAAVAIAGFAATGWVYHVLRVLDDGRVQERVDTEASRKAIELKARLRGIGVELSRMGRRWETRGTPPRYEWEADALQYVEPDSVFKAIEWASHREIVRWVVPLAGNDADVDLPLSAHPVRQEAALKAERLHGPVLSRAWSSEEGILAAFCVPLRIHGESDGTILGVVRVQTVLAEVLGLTPDRDFTYRVENDGLVLHDDGRTGATPSRRETVAVGGSLWTLEVRPTKEFLGTARSDVPIVALTLGLLVSLLLATAVGFARTARSRLRLLETAHDALVHEVADRRRAEEEIRRLNAELERRVDERTEELSRSNDELKRFAYVASHDLQEPLRAISSFTQLLARRYRGKLDRDADEFIGFAVDGCNRVQALINALLAYSRVDTRAAPFKAVRLEDALAAAAANLRIALDETGARITHESLPEVAGDEAQLVQLFQNLIGNAVKFRGSEPPLIRVSAERADGDEDAWTVSVVDNGIGLEPRFAERIFVIFQRLHRRDEYPGTGIGLAICKKIVERHGGRIWVESLPGEGAAFRFTLPAVVPAGDPLPEELLTGA